MKVRVFPDTNFFLHWAAFPTHDWRKLVHAESGDVVEIAIASAVFYELERHKDKHARSAVRKRALQTLTELESRSAEMSDGAVLGNGVTVRVLFDMPPPEAYATETLARDLADDRIVAAMINCRNAEDADRTVVLTGDRALRMKARARSLEAIEPPANQRERDDEEETEIGRLKTELADRQRELDEVALARPSLNVTIGGLGAEGGIELHQFERHWDDYSQELWMEAVQGLPSVQYLGVGPIGSLAMVGGGTVSASEAAQYEREQESFLEEHQRYVAALYEYEERAALTAPLTLRLSNVGKAIARDVSIRVRAVGDPSATITASRDEKPEPPDAPETPRSIMGFASLGSGLRYENYVQDLVTSMHRSRRADDLDPIEWQSLANGCIESKILVLHPGHWWDLPMFYLSLPAIPKSEVLTPKGLMELVVEVVADRMPGAKAFPLKVPYTIVARPPKRRSAVDDLIDLFAGESANSDGQV